MYSEEEIKTFIENQKYIYLKTELRKDGRWILVKCKCGHEEILMKEVV